MTTRFATVEDLAAMGVLDDLEERTALDAMIAEVFCHLLACEDEKTFRVLEQFHARLVLGGKQAGQS